MFGAKNDVNAEPPKRGIVGVLIMFHLGEKVNIETLASVNGG